MKELDQKQRQKQKAIAAVCVSAALILLLLYSMVAVVRYAAFGWFVNLMVEGCHAALIFCVVRVMLERIKELKEGYEDDLDNY